MLCATFYIIFGSGERQAWDDPDKDDEIKRKKEKKSELQSVKTITESRH